MNSGPRKRVHQGKDQGKGSRSRFHSHNTTQVDLLDWVSDEFNVDQREWQIVTASTAWQWHEHAAGEHAFSNGSISAPAWLSRTLGRRMERTARDMEEYKPAVTKVVLLFLAGGLWICVGAMLLSLAVSWLLETANIDRYVCAGSGVVLALLVHHFGFLRIVDKNLERILPVDKKRCVFSFMPWKSYLIIPVMITMGIVLRYSPVPKQYLAILYIGIGLALILSSVRYVRAFLKEIGRHTSA